VALAACPRFSSNRSCLGSPGSGEPNAKEESANNTMISRICFDAVTDYGTVTLEAASLAPNRERFRHDERQPGPAGRQARRKNESKAGEDEMMLSGI
jgi:hypothetical protein